MTATSLKISKKERIGLRPKNAASEKITTNLAISDGCKVIGPRASQRCATLSQMPGDHDCNQQS